MSSIHDRVTRVQTGEGAPPKAEHPTTAPNEGWLTFEAYVAWVATSSGVSSIALSTPSSMDGEREIEDQRSTIRSLSRRQTRRISRGHRRSLAALRRVLSKTG